MVLAIVGSIPWQQDSDGRDNRLRLRDAIRSDWDSEQRQVTRFWRLNKWDQADSLDDAFVSHLELRAAVQRLKIERPELWRTIMIVDILRPFAPAHASAVPEECRRRDGIAKAERALGLSKSGVEARLDAAYGLLVEWVMEKTE